MKTTEIIPKLKQIVRIGLKRDAKNCLAALFMEKFTPIYTMRDEDNKYLFYISSETALQRAQGLFNKEPDTIEWIKSFDKDDVFYDIGANVGAFTIYAAVKNKMKVYAFEPAFHNYYLLNRNIYLNKLENVMAFNMAFSNNNNIDMIYMKTTSDGDANVNLGTSTDCKKRPFAPQYIQPVFSYTIDDFIQRHRTDFPNHIKIDVDGLEPEIINGSTKTLADKRLKSILIEVNEADNKNIEMVETIKNAGFKIQKSKLSRYQADTFINYIFTRQR